nr:transglycosylase domain-containing protein [Noviherbaspirillum aridicola]
MFSLGLIAGVLLVAYTLLLIPFTPSIADLRRARNEVPSVLVSADGKRLATYNRLNREWVPLEKISPHVINALIATEDHRFYQHFGIEPLRMVVGAGRALIGDPEGGSTITQQLARNMYPEQIGRQRTITRKLKEIITALKLEHAYSKRQILESYLNTVPFLYNAYGIEMAARTYFDKPASRLGLLESATLVGMLKGTSYYNPVQNPERSQRRRNVVLSQMVKRNLLSRAQYDTLAARPVRLDFERQQEALGPAPHFAQHLKRWLIEWADRNDYNIYSDGLVIHTTIDSRLQAMANRAVQRQLDALQAVANVEWAQASLRPPSAAIDSYLRLQRGVQPFAHFWQANPRLLDTFIRESSAYARAVDGGAAPEEALARLRADAEFTARLRADKTRLQAGFVAIDPVTAQVRAWVGSRDYAADQFDHVGQMRRQPGSTFKPFVYGAALEAGMSPRKQFIDTPIEVPLSDGTVWRPSDVTPPTGKPMTARDGLVLSKNTITARVMQETGPKKAAELARRMGVDSSRLDPVPALALGTSPVTPVEMVSAYATLAAGGEYRKPVLVTRIADRHGNVLAEFDADGRRAVSRETAEELTDMLRAAVSQGTGQGIRSRFGIRADVAGKTGTTQDNTDGWFILMHARLVAGAWVGFNDSRVTMRSGYWGQGAHNALLPVGDFFRQALDARLVDAQAQLPRPDESLFGRLWETIEGWFGGDEPPPPEAPPPRDDGGSLLEPVEDLVRQAREIERTWRRWQERLEDFMEAVQRLIDKLPGGGDARAAGPQPPDPG